MNHDATHCSDFTEECPKECFRAQLARDLGKEALWFAHVGLTVSFAHLKGTEECALVKEGSGTDLIRREDAIQAVANDCDGLEPEQALQYARDLISGCPTQGDERKAGKWIRTKNGLLCSECRSGVKNQPLLMRNPMFCYCPFCGVKMEGCE